MSEPTRDGSSGYTQNPATVFAPAVTPPVPTQPTSSTAADTTSTSSAPPASSPTYTPASPVMFAPAAPAPVATTPAATDTAPGDAAPTRTEVVSDRAAELVNDAVDKAGEVVDKAGEVLTNAAHKAGDAISGAADKAGDAIGEAAGNAMTRLRNNASLPATRGKTTIANEVVEKIAGIAAREVPGVYDLGGDVARVFSAVRERLHLGDDSKAQGVSVRLDGRTAEVTVTIVIEFGFVIGSVTDKVREKVISSVENLLGLEVTNVDIVVDDIHVEEEGPVGDDVARASGYSSDTPGIVVGR